MVGSAKIKKEAANQITRLECKSHPETSTQSRAYSCRAHKEQTSSDSNYKPFVQYRFKRWYDSAFMVHTFFKAIQEWGRLSRLQAKVRFAFNVQTSLPKNQERSRFSRCNPVRSEMSLLTAVTSIHTAQHKNLKKE